MNTNITNDLLMLKKQLYGKYHEVNAEIHITFDINGESEILKFKAACEKHDIKVVVINLLNGEKFHIMTSERVRRPLHEIYYVIKDTLNDLWEFKSTRFKVEVDINSMNDELESMVEYYESHIDCDISSIGKLALLGLFLTTHDYKMSKNIKQTIDTISITKRYVVKSDDIYNEYRFLWNSDIAKTKLEIECVIFDSNIALDANW